MSACKKAKTDDASPAEALQQHAETFGCKIDDKKFAEMMDNADKIGHLRKDFYYPKMGEIPTSVPELVKSDEDCLYMCGNSLGLQPRKAKTYINEDLDKWAKMGVHGHFVEPRPWALCDEGLQELSSKIVGAQPEEVCVMNGLTVNLHLLMISFYKPTAKRHKIFLEAKAFPSDHYAVESQLKIRGYDNDSMILAEPREGEITLRTEDILATIEKQGDEIAVVLFPGVQYYTGQLFDMEAITAAAHKKGCIVGFDLAHAVGNAELHLHDWNVDFACWCSYKYLNAGAGGIAGAFIHNNVAEQTPPALVGWWGHTYGTRFAMSNELDLSPGISAYRLSNPPILLVSPLLASLEVFGKTTMSELRAKSLLLTAYLEHMVNLHYSKSTGGKATVTIITPTDPAQRGNQLSLMFSEPIKKVFLELEKRGVVCDKREPDVLRIAPAPIYNSFTDVFRFMGALGDSLEAASSS
jgi:kynureninase